MRLAKYQALGNDYLVIQPDELPVGLTPEVITRLCDRHTGLGADGILLGPLSTDDADFGLCIFNPDGSEAEKSGNGLRIFARWLREHSLAQPAPAWFRVRTSGGLARCQVDVGGAGVTVEMGKISFDSDLIPVSGPRREALNERMQVGGVELAYSAATLGNPHCVILRETVSTEEVMHLGPLIERLPRFPNRTNVQFVQALDAANLRLEIWERGAGYTLASGSSACAATAVAHRLGLCQAQVNVHMPGGVLEVSLSPDWQVTHHGPVVKVYEGELEFG